MRKTFNEANADEDCAGIITRMHIFSPAKSWILGSLKQLPGLAIQRLMQKGYGFGGEGDWKTAAMVRLMKIMASGIKAAKGISFMEDYTYNLVTGKEGILQAHMLEVCTSVAEGKVGIKVCPLSMGNREDPARLVHSGFPNRIWLPALKHGFLPEAHTTQHFPMI